jgi:hypothetical protein
MAKRREDRYPSARRFADALRRVADGKPPEEPGEVVVGAPSSEAEREFWDGVKDSDDAEELALYIQQFPRGAYVQLAQRRIAELQGKKT